MLSRSHGVKKSLPIVPLPVILQKSDLARITWRASAYGPVDSGHGAVRANVLTRRIEGNRHRFPGRPRFRRRSRPQFGRVGDCAGEAAPPRRPVSLSISKGVPCGSWAVTAIKDGFENKTQPVQIASGANVEVTLILTPKMQVTSVDVTDTAPRLEQSASEKQRSCA